ncbi:MAG: zinc-ribbon domain containing protein [Pyrinomonadaceae bacterium]
MADSDFEGIPTASIGQAVRDVQFTSKSINCMDCRQIFIWTAGEQRFYQDKHLSNPPKRCKECKTAKNRRLAAVARGRVTGKRQRIDVHAECAKCEAVTTVPFYPSQGRPVYCRACFLEMNTKSNGAKG